MHDLTVSISSREINIKQNDWMEQLIWRSDGVHSSDPIFTLVIYKHKVCKQLHNLSSVCFNILNSDSNTTINYLKIVQSNSDDHNFLQMKLFTFAFTISETKPYWLVKYQEFNFTSIFKFHINKMYSAIFIRVSQLNIMVVGCS